jgi:hypothetical protein
MHGFVTPKVSSDPAVLAYGFKVLIDLGILQLMSPQILGETH